MILYFKKCNNNLKIKNTYKRIDPITKKFDKLDIGYYFLEDRKETENTYEIPYIFYSSKWYEDIAIFKKEKIDRIEVVK